MVDCVSDNNIKLNKIKDFKKKKDFTYIDIPQEYINNIYDVYFNNKEIDDINISDTECLYYGVYYDINNQRLDLMENNQRLYLMAIDKGNYTAMTNLAYYYQDIANYDKMKKSTKGYI